MEFYNQMVLFLLLFLCYRSLHFLALVEEGAERAMKNAMKGLETKIDYINPHATSTPQLGWKTSKD